MLRQTILAAGAPNGCYHASEPGRIRIAFDDHRLVSNAGPILPVTLAQRLGYG